MSSRRRQRLQQDTPTSNHCCVHGCCARDVVACKIAAFNESSTVQDMITVPAVLNTHSAKCLKASKGCRKFSS